MSGKVDSWTWHHVGISVKDIDRALDYYRGNLGFEVKFEARNMTDLISSITGVQGLGAHVVQTKSPLSDLVLEFIEFFNVPDDLDPLLPIAPGRSHNAFLVPNIDKALDNLLADGGIMLGMVTEFAEGKAVYCADSFGTVIELEEQLGEHGDFLKG